MWISGQLLHYIITQAPARPSVFESLLPIIIIIVIFYFLLIRPQQKRMKMHKKFLDALEKGQEVVTSGGIVGRVSGIAERVVTLDVGNGVKIKFLKEQIMGPYRENQNVTGQQ